MIINKIVASSWDLSSFLYMMHGHTYIKFRILCISLKLFTLLRLNTFTAVKSFNVNNFELIHNIRLVHLLVCNI